MASRRTAPLRWWIARGVAVAGLLASSIGLAQISPGDLARPHARLEGVENCTKCHSSGDAVSEDKCLSCHTALRARIRKGAGYHAKVRGRACESCHPDHRGRGASMIVWPGGGQRRFDHARNTGYPLRGKHAEAACRDCHKAALVRGEMGGASRGRTFLGMPTTCVGCHQDPHEPSLGTSCQNCHDESGWGRAKQGFDHSKARFPLRGAHARVDCARCHPGATEDRPATFRGVAFALCTDCHQDPHLAKMGPPASCASCHNEQRWQALRYDLARHAPRTFPLTGAHVRTACTACHGAKLTNSVRTQCSACHRDAHRPSLGAACNQCHTTEAWSGRGAVGARPPATFHDRTAFPLQGKHAAVACPECHSPRVPAARRFRPIAHGRCLDCHEDPHHGELASRSDGGACESCHDVEGWAPARFEAEEHAASRFPLDGAHRAVPCAGCHAPAPAAPGFRREDRSCEGCHQDPHGGQFTGRVSAQSGCAGCHATLGWAPSRFGKPEHAATGFALVERHDAPCVRCHAPNRASAVTAFVGTSRECGSCHADVHAGQFAGTACSTCHAGARFRPTVGFDHARTRMPLRGRHRQARCPDCHRAVDLPGAPRTVVYRLGAPPSCEGCHDSPHGDPESRGRAGALARATGDCDACHRESDWRTVTLTGAARFDHAKTDAPLVGAHEAVPCEHCHVGSRRVSKMQACGSCHEDRHAGRLTDPCTTCHTPRTWAPDRTLDEHRRTRFPLVGAHAAQACRTCHRRAAQGDFRDARPACETCHLDTVRERAPHPPHVGVAFLTRCDRCHGADEWRPAHFDHDRFWPLTGRHESAACSGCHQAGQFAGTPRECAACHEGEQAGGRVDHGIFDDDDCGRCHATTGWRPAEFPEHAGYFPLRGHHDRACDRCHTDESSFAVFTCLGSGCHTRGEIDEEHSSRTCQTRNGVRQCYAWTGDAFATSALCYFCHPRGEGD